MFQDIWALISQCMGCFYFGTCTTLLPSAEKHLTSNHSHFYPQFQSRLVIRNYHGWNLIFCSALEKFPTSAISFSHLSFVHCYWKLALPATTHQQLNTPMILSSLHNT